MRSAIDLLRGALTEQGYEGLYRPDECSCEVDGLASFCGGISEECMPGHKRACTCDECDGWHMGGTKP